MTVPAKNSLKSCLPPDPNPVRPALVLPPGACDAHCHIFGPAATFPFSADSTYTPPDSGIARIEDLKGKLILRACKALVPGDEITCDYGSDYFDLFIAPVGCRCATCAATR